MRTGMKEMVIEASQALARLDVERLEELAIACQALNRDMPLSDARLQMALLDESRESAKAMAVFAGVLDATRANMNVVNRLREMRAGRLEYGSGDAAGWACRRSGHGDN